MQEIWKPVPGYEELYEVSNLGRLKSLRNNHIMSLCPNSRKYLGANLCRNGEVKGIHIHRLVAEVFCDRPDGKDVVDHINNNKNDNRACNLRWVTQQENVRFSSRVRPVVRSDGKFYESLRAVAEDGFNAPTVCECCQGKHKTHRGFTWAYVV